MRKLLVLTLVLSLCSIANAGMVDLVIVGLDGAPIAPTKEIAIMDSQTIDLDIVYDGTNPNLGNLQVNIVAVGPGTLDMTELTLPPGAWDELLSYAIWDPPPSPAKSITWATPWA